MGEEPDCACDALNGRVQVSAEIAADDIIYGFYFYQEPDLVYTALDINPFSNPAVKNKKIEFVYRADPADDGSPPGARRTYTW